MSSWYEILEKRNKEIEALKKEITKLEESKAYFENRIREEEESNSANNLNKEFIISKVQDLQNKIDNFHFKHKLKIESDYTINKLTLIYYCEDFSPVEISTSGATMLHELEKWIEFQNRIIPIYKFLEDLGENLIYSRVKSQYNNNYKDSIVSFKCNYDNHDYEEVLYLLKFNTLDYSTFDLMAYKKILSNAVKCSLSLDNNGLDAHIVTPEAEESFDDRDFEPNEEFNVYLVARRYSIDETSLNDLIKETAEQILNYTDFEEEHY